MRKEIVVALIGASAIIAAALTAGLFRLSDKNVPPVFRDLSADKSHPQRVGTTVRLSADAGDADGDVVYYSFWLRKPDEAREFVQLQNWSSQSWWDWQPTEAGKYQVEARVRDGHHASDDGHDDARVLVYEFVDWMTPSTAETPEGKALDWIQKGIALEDAGNFGEAVAAYGRAIQLNPKNEEAWIKKGKSLLYMDKYEASITATQKALELNPSSSTGWNNRSMALYNLGRFSEALADLNAAIKIDPKDPVFLSNKCSILRIESVGRYIEAIQACDESIQIDPTSAIAWNHKGGALYSMNNFTEALAAYDRAVGLDPNSELIWYNRGTALFMLKRYQDSINSLDKAIAFNSTNVASPESEADGGRGATQRKLARSHTRANQACTKTSTGSCAAVLLEA